MIRDCAVEIGMSRRRVGRRFQVLVSVCQLYLGSSFRNLKVIIIILNANEL
jgi:hypothetical protein